MLPLLSPCTTSHDHTATERLSSEQIEQRVTATKLACQQQGLRFTPLREQVFRLILQSPIPIGAYDLLAQLQQLQAKPVAPPTVYRGLDFLLNHGFIHQLSSSNAFFACCQPDDKHIAAFLLCKTCGNVQEFSHSPIDTVVQQVAKDCDFSIQTTVIELLGICAHCRQDTLTQTLSKND